MKLIAWLLLLTLYLGLVKASVHVISTNETYAGRTAAFGPRLLENGKFGYLIEPQDPFACNVVEPVYDNWIALVRRGQCSFITKVRNMQKSGAIAVVVGDPDHSSWVTMYAPGDTTDVLIPSMFLTRREYRSLIRLTKLVDGPLMVLMQPEDFITWPLFDVLIIVIISPCIMMSFIYLSWKIRQRQKHKQDLAPVDVVMKLTMKIFSREKIRENEAEECAICLEDYADGDELRVLPCKHDFHVSCVDAWLTTQKKFCPICKRDITCISTSEVTPLLDA
ncbi:uncharacterized protein BYT42DRAFT_567645 [Radiomyces spectabilis]|uniref:uncharacterized protein n=1 Tax=Radiomyces spectabilis TaxID=64574 RepID=UPI00221F1072|nr:uncharacterized protein BYT42DRAFT_567645 [Radiomyces spectabilis]KAI8379127.1 hypothetical protein BYT42DRAFT_567645 [Radiomyces spectabilis]